MNVRIDVMQQIYYLQRARSRAKNPEFKKLWDNKLKQLLKSTQ